ncbi:MAG: right-handed parallel beta-helix repeat-containing protein [Clostridia bacterium]|nr:right-handed parallel beta-helix repeat-containing protein [Clostridia bacterium]MDY6184379.1 right-handed parallel beta-helix repeat-containing protein [Eubacteriales bacterium]
MKQTKRTLVSLLLVFAMLATCLVAFSVTGTAAGEADVWDGKTYTEPTKKDADGTTILVTTAAEFAWVAQNPASAAGSYRLTVNVDMNAKTPSAHGTFSGILNGDGHYVSNITDKGGSGYGSAGLFGTISGTIKNLTIKDSRFTAFGSNYNAPFATSGLSGTLENCHVVGCTINGICAAGLVNSCSGTIRNCTVDATISASTETNQQDHNIGGICVSVSSTKAVIENCTVNGTISGTNYKTKSVIAGGLVAYISIVHGSWSWTGLKDCVNNATITVGDKLSGDALPTGTSGAVGGLVGRVTRGTANNNAGQGTLTLNNCVNNGSITVTSDATVTRGVGGLVGCTSDGIVKAIDCVNNANVNAPTVLGVGGFIGTSSPSANVYYGSGTSEFKNCGQYGAITGAGNVACAIGYTYQNTTLNNVVLAGSVNLPESVAENALTGIVIAFQTSYTNQSKTLSDHTLAMTNVYSPVTAALYNTDTAATGTLNVTSTSVVTGDAFTSGDLASFATALNTAATTNDWNQWIVVAAPKYIVFAVQVAIDGATLSLNDTMTLKLFVRASAVSEIADNLKSIMVNDGTEDGNYAGTLNTETGYFVFEISGLAAKDMGTAKTYKVKYTLTNDTANTITCKTGVEYSPLQYAINMYNKNKADTTPNANFAALLTSMVRYMDAAGATGAKTTFATKTGYTFDDTTVDADYAKIVAKDAESNFTVPENTIELSAVLESGITMIVKPADGKTFTDVSVKIGDKVLAVETADGTWRVNGLNPGDLYNELTFTFTISAEETVTATYSVARYLNNYVSTKYETLAKATALYMDAFITYKTIG